MDVLFFVTCVLSFREVYTYILQIKNNKTGVTWKEASNECGDLGLEYEHSTLQKLEGLGTNEFWTGIIKYPELTPWIEPIGCFMKNSSKSTSQETIGNCQIYCQRTSSNATYFGFSRHNKECQCLKSEEIHSAENSSLTSCQQNQNDYMMYYRRFDFDGHNTDLGMKCLLTRCKFGQHIEYHPQMCSKSNATIQTLCQDGESPEGQIWSITYKIAERKCLDIKKLLVSPSLCYNDQLKWTNVFREEITVNRFNEQQKTSRPLSCFSGKRVDSKTSIIVTRFDCCSKMKWFVCRTYNTKDDKNIEGNNVVVHLGPIISAVIGGFVSLMVIVIVTVYFIRRKKVHNQRASKEKYLTEAQLKTCDENEDTNYHYITENKLDKSKSEYVVVQNEDHHKVWESDATYVIATEEDYDMLNNVSNRKIKSTGNIYGMASKCGNDEYDISCIVKSATAVQMTDLYDLNISSTRKSDLTYDNPARIKILNSGADGLYDHTV